MTNQVIPGKSFDECETRSSFVFLFGCEPLDGLVRKRRYSAKYEDMHNRFMQRAIQLAVENVNSRGGGPFGAVIVVRDEIIGEGANLVTIANDPTAHAEIVAIRQACSRLKTFELSNCEIYASCEPCPMCLGAIFWARIHAIYFAATANDAAEAGFDDRFFYEQLRLPREKRAIPMKQIMRADGLAVFRAWAAKADKVKY